MKNIENKYIDKQNGFIIQVYKQIPNKKIYPKLIEFKRNYIYSLSQKPSVTHSFFKLFFFKYIFYDHSYINTNTILPDIIKGKPPL